nr:serine/threonine-protein kinase [Nocardioides daedukensis]
MQVGDYELLTRIGEGGMGVVHLARRPGGQRVALKVLRPHVVGDAEARERLAREVKSLSRVQLPRIAEIVDADPWGPVPFVATRYVPGLNLHDHVAEEGPLEGADLIVFARGLAEAIQAVHHVGVLHRDVKPSNVLMEGRHPVLIDFGLARLADDERITRTGYLMGTPGYLAPEVLFGHEPTSASDVHAWAGTVTFAGLGRGPFGKGPSMAVLDRVRRGDHDLDGLGYEVLGLVVAALDPDPANRPTLTQLIARLGEDAIRDRSRPGRKSVPAPATMTMPLSAAPDFTATEVVGNGPNHVTSGVTSGEAPTRQQPPGQQPPHPQAASHPAAQPQASPSAGESFMAPARSPYQQPPPPQSGYPGQPGAGPHSPHHQGTPQQSGTPQQQGTPQQSAPQQSAPPRPSWAVRLRRTTLGLGLLAAVGSGVAAGPWLTLSLVTALVILLRSVSLSSTAATQRRNRRGTKWYDGLVDVLAAPWHFLVSLPLSLLLVAWGWMLAACVALVLLLLGVEDIVLLLVSGLVLGVSVWTGPGSSRVRTPVRNIGRPMAGDTMWWGIGVVVLCAITALMLYTAGSNGVEWTPTNTSPWGGNSWLAKLDR